MNTLYYGDCLTIMRERMADASVDLTYLDPPHLTPNAITTLSTRTKRDAHCPTRSRLSTTHGCWMLSVCAPSRRCRYCCNNTKSTVQARICCRALCRRWQCRSRTWRILGVYDRAVGEIRRVLKPTGSIYRRIATQPPATISKSSWMSYLGVVTLATKLSGLTAAGRLSQGTSSACTMYFSVIIEMRIG